MKMRHFLRRSLAIAVLLATILTLAPTSFATADSGKVTRAITPVQNDNINLSGKEIIAFYIDPAYFTATDAKIDALTARGVTDFYVMVKDYEGDLDTSLLSDVIGYAGTSVKVHAWISAARDDTYLASNPTHAQYHFRVGTNCNAHSSSDSNYDTRNGFVDLANSSYITYFNKQIDTLEAVSGIDGIVVDIARYGADYYGFGPELKAKVTKAEYNELAKALCAHYGYNYNSNGTLDGTSGYYTFKDGNGTADNKSFTDLLNANGTAAQKFITHRTDTVKNFLSKVKASCAIPVGVVYQPEVLTYSADSECTRNNYGIGTYGQDPAKMPSVTDYLIVNSFMGDYYSHAGSAYRTDYPAKCATAFAKMGCNVVAGIQGDAFSNDDEEYSSSNTSGRNNCYASGHDLRNMAEYLNDARRLINGDPTVGGDILGAAVREAGSSAMARVTYSGGVFTVNLVAGSAAISEIQIRLNNSLYVKTTSTSYTYNSQTWTAGGTASSGGYYPRISANISVAAYGTKTLKLQVCTATGGTPSLSYNNEYPVSVNVWNSTTNNNSTVRSCYLDSHIGSAHTACSFTKTTPQAATCTSAGYNLYTCSTCGYDYSEYVAKDANAHTVVTDPAVAPTCTSTGLTEGSHCSLCNTVITAQTTVAMLAHTQVTTPASPATCTEPGTTGGTHCSVCNTVLVAAQTIPALGHNEQILPAVEASCTESGMTEGSYCLTCGEIIISQMVIEPFGHDYIATVTPPSCETNGYTTYTCSVCNHSYTGNTVASAGHDYIASVTEPTCVAGGYTTYTCSVCKHSYTANQTPATDHDYIATVTPPTCESEGYTTYTCSACGASYKDNTTPKTAHDYVATVHAPTCTSIGYTEYICKCGDSYAADFVPALSHSFVYTDNGNGHTVTCKNCTYSATEDHTLSGVHCILCYAFVCDHSRTKVIVDTAATCTAAGSSHTECTICGVTVSTQAIPATGHNVTYTPAKNASCNVQGNRAYWQCANCKLYFADESCSYVLPESFIHTPAKSHSYTSTVIAPTCTEEGYTRFTCSNCYDTYTENEVAALGHSYTYTNNGENHTIGCSRCTYSATTVHVYISGTCPCGASEKPSEPQASLDTNLKFTMNISVGAAMSVSYNVMASAVSSYADFYLEVSKANADGEPTVVTYGLSEGHEPMTNMMNIIYSATYEGISAKQMGDEFSTTLYAIDENGNIYYGETVTESIKGYLVKKASEENATDAFKTMAVDMLKYGAEAQNIFDYATDKLVTADLSKDLLGYATVAIPEATDISSASGSGAAISANVTVGSKVELGLSIFKTGLSAPDTVRCEIRDAEGKLIAEPAVSNAMNMMFSAGYSDVGAREMRKPITATFYMGNEAISQTITWSVESYVAQVRANENSTESDIAMVNAMLTYGDSVGAYLTSVGQ